MRILFLLLLSFSAYGQAFNLLSFNTRREAEDAVEPSFERYIDNDDIGAGNNQLTYSGTWAHDQGTKTSMYGESYSYSQTTNSYVEARCDNCYQWKIYSELYPWHGKAEIKVDGVVVGELDQWAEEEAPSNVLWTSDELTDGPHTIRLTVLGTANAGNVSGNEYIVVDAFIYNAHGTTPPPVDEDSDWVVDDTGGSNSGPCNATTPCLTINEAAQRALPGDIVLIKGGTYRETIVPLNSGTSGNDITYKAAEGETVIISGLNVLTPSWANYSGQIYRTAASLPRTGHTSTLNSNTGLLANQIFQNGVMQFEGSTRNLTTINDLFDKTKWKALSAANFPSTSATDGIFNGKSLTNATVVIQGWFAVDSRTVNAHSGNGNTIGFPGYSDNSSGGQQYRRWIYASNDIDLVDQAMEWHYDGTYLYLWQSGGGTPTGTIEYKARNWGFDLRSKSRIIIKDITFKGCEPVTGNDATNYVIVDNIRSTYANHSVTHQTYRWQGVGMTRQMGLKLTGIGNVLRNSEISYSSTQGVWIGANGRVENNYIHHIGYDGGWGAGVDLWGEGTAAAPVDNIVVTRNTISHTARSSVSLGYGFEELFHRQFRNLEISYNDFSEWCLFSDDGGATYTWGYRDHTGSTVHHNWFHDAGFVLNPLNLPVPGRLDGIAVAFYTDQGGGPFTVHHNVFWNNVEIPTAGSPGYLTGWDSDAADVYTQPTFQGGANPPGYRNNGGSKFYNNTFWSNAPWTGKSNPNNTPPEPFRNNIMRRTWNFFPASSPDLGSEGSNIYNSAVNPLFNGGSLATPQIYFGLQAGSPAVNTGMVINGITTDAVGTPDKGAYERTVTPWIPGHDW